MTRAPARPSLCAALVTTALAVALPAVADPHGSPAEAGPALVPGSKGTTRTVLEGDRIDEIPLTYLGTYRDFAGPGYDLHLVRLEGPTAERLGVASGMSGSPVFVDDRLIGALSYRMGSLPTEPVAGVTPIEQMLDSSAPRRGRGSAADPAAALIATPILAVGMVPEARHWLASYVKEQGMLLVGGGDGAPLAPRALEPGSPVGALLMRGDLKIAAIGTVTWVDGDRVYAFGHPFFGFGRVDMPMVSAHVIHTLADLAGSMKLANVGAELGAIVDDRFAAVVGRTGVRSRMIPMTIELTGGDYGAERFRFELVSSSSLVPLLAGAAVANSLLTHVGYNAESTLLARGTVRLAGLPDLPLEMAFSGGPESDPSLNLASGLIQVLGSLWGNRFVEPSIEGIDLEIDARAERVSFRLEDVQYDRGSLGPRRTLRVRCTLSRYRGGSFAREIEIVLPGDLPRDRELLLAVGNPQRVDLALGRPWQARLSSVADGDSLVRVLADRHSSHRLEAALFDAGRAVISRGHSYGGLPPTAVRLLATQTTQTSARPAASILARADLELEGPVDGGFLLRLDFDSTLDAEGPPPPRPEPAPADPPSDPEQGS